MLSLTFLHIIREKLISKQICHKTLPKQSIIVILLNMQAVPKEHCSPPKTPPAAVVWNNFQVSLNLYLSPFVGLPTSYVPEERLGHTRCYLFPVQSFSCCSSWHDLAPNVVEMANFGPFLGLSPLPILHMVWFGSWKKGLCCTCVIVIGTFSQAFF